MMGIDETLKQIEQRVDRFYETAIKLHEHAQLRAFMGEPMKILQPQYGAKLGYGAKGFYAVVPECIDSGSYCEDAVFEYPEYWFVQKAGKLVVKSHDGRQEMLHLFPKLTAERLEEAIEKELEKRKQALP